MKQTKSAQRVNRTVGDTDKCMLRYKHTDYTLNGKNNHKMQLSEHLFHTKPSVLQRIFAVVLLLSVSLMYDKKKAKQHIAYDGKTKCIARGTFYKNHWQTQMRDTIERNKQEKKEPKHAL